MKWLMVAGALGAFALIGRIARTNERVRQLLGVAIGLCPFFKVTLNPISYEMYRGDARGLEFHLADFVALAAACAIPPDPERRPLPLRWRFALYAATAAISVLQAPEPLFAWFGVWRVLRTIFLFAMVTRACRSGGLAPRILDGLAFGIVISGGLALKQRYLEGLMAAKGPFEHQNGLGMTVNMVVPFCYAVMLNGKGGWLARGAVACGGVAVVLTLSRGGLFNFALSCALVFIVSLARKVSRQKLAILGASVLGAVGLLIKSWSTLVERFTTAPEASAEARHVFEDAAKWMLRDHPMGIGMNQFSLVLDRSYADPLDIPEVDRDGLVHNIYWLTAAELGYGGIVAYVLLLTAPFFATAAAFRRDRTVRGDVLLGFAASFFVTYLQGKLEWALRMTQVSYVLWVIAGVAMHLAAETRRPTRS